MHIHIIHQSSLVLPGQIKNRNASQPRLLTFAEFMPAYFCGKAKNKNFIKHVRIYLTTIYLTICNIQTMKKIFRIIKILLNP